MRTDQSPAHQHIGHLAALLSLQARSRRNALHAARLLRVHRTEQREADDAVRAGGATEASTPTLAREVAMPAQSPAARSPHQDDDLARSSLR